MKFAQFLLIFCTLLILGYVIGGCIAASSYWFRVQVNGHLYVIKLGGATKEEK